MRKAALSQKKASKAADIILEKAAGLEKIRDRAMDEEDKAKSVLTGLQETMKDATDRMKENAPPKRSMKAVAMKKGAVKGKAMKTGKAMKKGTAVKAGKARKKVKAMKVAMKGKAMKTGKAMKKGKAMKAKRAGNVIKTAMKKSA